MGLRPDIVGSGGSRGHQKNPKSISVDEALQCNSQGSTKEASVKHATN